MDPLVNQEAAVTNLFYWKNRIHDWLYRLGFDEAAPRLAREVLELLAAPDCPTRTTDVLLAPDQMILQIHESIGHPLELDRILGDERNYAGLSFVTPEMFGSYRYGSPLLHAVALITNVGLLGKITKVGESFVTVELADNVRVRIQKHAVASVMPKGTIKST